MTVQNPLLKALTRTNFFSMPKAETELNLTILLTVVSGKEAVRRCLEVLSAQIDFAEAEIIVPFDKFSAAVGELAAEFPEVRFHPIEDLGLANNSDICAFEHRLYDRRRAVGLRLARGRIVAMIEDHARPAADWCRRILEAHEQPFEVIGGAIENAVDAPLNWAWYYCDFGRYGRPLKGGEAEYVSDINVSYKRRALEASRDIWREAYHETIVHWTLQKRGVKLFLNDKIIVFQHRPPLPLKRVWRERLDWGRIFAETRSNQLSFSRRLIYAAGTIFLPPLLFVRALKNMRRQNRRARQIVSVAPYILLLLTGWSLGELTGYLRGEPAAANEPKIKTRGEIVAE